MDHFLVDASVAQGKVSPVWHPGLPLQAQGCLCPGQPEKEKETEGVVMMGAGPGVGTPWQGRQLGSCGLNSLFPTLLPSQQCGRPPGPPEAPSP